MNNVGEMFKTQLEAPNNISELLTTKAELERVSKIPIVTKSQGVSRLNFFFRKNPTSGPTKAHLRQSTTLEHYGGIYRISFFYNDNKLYNNTRNKRQQIRM